MIKQKKLIKEWKYQYYKKNEFLYKYIIKLIIMDLNELDTGIILDRKVNIRLKQRNGKKCHTFKENLFEEITDEDELKKKFSKLTSKLKSAGCGGSIIKDEETQKLVIMLNGDHCERVKEYLINQKLYVETEIKLHGF